MRYTNDKELNKIIRKQIKNGWVFQKGGKHCRLVHPMGQPFITLAKSPSDYRSIRNIRALLRKMG